MADALGFALGCVGLSLPDFCALTPSEFRAVCDAWGRRNEGLEQGAWERMRLLATITIQPHVKKRLTPGSCCPCRGIGNGQPPRPYRGSRTWKG